MLGRHLRTLNWKVAAVRKEWASSNPLRLKYETGWFRRTFHLVCEHPLKWTAFVFFGALLLCAIAWVCPPPYPGPVNWQPNPGEPGKKWDAIAPFVGLWAVQAALVAVVYPIVVAFVTILLQRQSASKASLQAYFSRSAARLTGLSSLGLVLLMAIQYVVLDQAPELVIYAWLIGDSVWAAVNVAITILFLHATFEFATPEGRAAARFDYVLTQAWPAEWEHHVKRLISHEPLKHGLVTGVWAVEDLDGTEPAFSNPGDGLAKEHAAHLHFRRERSVANIRYMLVQLVFWMWCRQVRSVPTDGTKRAGWRRMGPVFQFSITYGERFALDTPIAMSSGAMPLQRLQRWLLRAALSLRYHQVAPRVLVRDALEELRMDAAQAIESDAQAEFERQVRGLMELLDAVVEASGYTSDGKFDNWVILTDTEHVGFSEELIWTWLRIVRDLHGVALKAIVVRDVFAAATVKLGSRLILRQQKSLTDKLRQIYVDHQFLLLYDLLGWGAEGCAAASSNDGSPGKVLDEPLRRRYDRVLREGIGAWESMKNFRLLPRDYGDRLSWEESDTIGTTLGGHLGRHVQLVAHAMRADDRVGFEYFVDSLMKWVGQRGWHQAESGLEYGDRYRVTISDLALPLTAFRARFPLPSYETEGFRSFKAVTELALKNLWRDVVLTLVASALNQANSKLISRELTGRLVQHLIDGIPILDEGDSTGASRAYENADRVLSALVRQLVEGVSQDERYKERIDKIAQSVGFSAMDRGISERVYSMSGSDIDHLLDAQLVLMARLAPANWRPGSYFENTMRSWAPEDDLRRHMLAQLKAWITRLEDGDLHTKYAWLWVVVMPEGGATIEEHIIRAKGGLERLREGLRNLRETELREAEIADIARTRLASAAAKVLAQPPKWFPLSLLKKPIQTSGPLQSGRDASFKVSGYDKGALTEPPMAPVDAQEEEQSFSNMTERALAIEVLRDVVFRADAEEREALNTNSWLEELRDWATKCQSSANHPAAVFPSRVDPPWVSDLVRKRVGETDEAAQVRKRSEFSEQRSYIGHYGEIALFTGPVPAGITALLTIDEFELLLLGMNGDQPFLVDAVPDETGLKCSLTISWRQQLQGTKGPVLRLRHSSVENR